MQPADLPVRHDADHDVEARRLAGKVRENGGFVRRPVVRMERNARHDIVARRIQQVGREAGEFEVARRGVELVLRDFPVPVPGVGGAHGERIALLGEQQRLLGELALRDVGEHADDALGCAVRITENLPAAADRARLLAAQDAVFELVVRAPPGERLAPLGRDARPVVRVEAHLRHEVRASAVLRVQRQAEHPECLGGVENLVGPYVPVPVAFLGHLHGEGVASFRKA